MNGKLRRSYFRRRGTPTTPRCGRNGARRPNVKKVTALGAGEVISCPATLEHRVECAVASAKYLILLAACLSARAVFDWPAVIPCPPAWPALSVAEDP